MQLYGSCEVGRWIRVADRFLPNIVGREGLGSRMLSALKIGGGDAPYLLLLPSRMAGLPVPGDERRSHLEQQRL